MKARKQKGGIPAGSAALKAVAKEEGMAVDRLAHWIGSDVLVKKGSTGRSVSSSFLEKISAHIADGNLHIPIALRREADKFGVDLIGLIEAAKNRDGEKCRLILARPNARGDAAIEEAFKADDEESKVRVWIFIEGEWAAENPGKTPKPGEVLRWQAARQKEVDEARAAASVKLKARAKAAGDRDITPPVLLGDELAAALESFRQIPWEDREQWPTIDDVRVSTGMSRGELGRILSGGRRKGRKNRNVWKGSSCKSPSGGCPPSKISPLGMQRIIRAFLKKRKLPVDRARELLEFFGSVKF